jgi:pimeloyl-ACP methyl ester carboxylesterase
MAHVLRIAALAALVAGCGPVPGQSFKQLSYPMPVSHVSVDGIDVAFTDVGQGPRTLVLIHGLASYMPVWTRNLDELQREARVVAIDLPGYGKSSKANYEYSMAFYARVVDKLIDTLHLQHVVLVGHSMGGQIAMTHALRHPGRAEALVLLAPAGFEGFGPGEGSWMSSAVNKDFVMLTPPDAIVTNYATNFYNMPREAKFMAEDRIRIIGGPDFDAYAYAVTRSVYAMIHEPVRARLGEIEVPVLVIFGRDDQLIPNPILHGGATTEVARDGTSRLKHGRLVIIPRAGHMVQFERPHEVDRAVLDFLKEIP